MESNIKIDVIIPIYNPDAKFEQMFLELQKQTVQVNKFVICETVNKKDEFIKQAPKRIVHKQILQEEYDHGRTRNNCVKDLDSDYILFMTQDAIPCNNKLIENLLNGFKNNVACVYAKQVAYPDCNEIEAYTRKFNYPDYDIVKNKQTENIFGIKNYFCSNVCCMYDKKVFDKLAGFEENIILNEDTFYAYKAIQNGYSIVYKADAKVYHSHNYTFEEYMKRNFDIAVSQEKSNIDFDQFPSTTEGKKLVLNSFMYFLERLKIKACISLIIASYYKYKGYRMGRKYKKLDKDTILKYTMNKRFWE